LSFNGWVRHTPKPLTVLHWELCPPLAPPEWQERNLTGHQFGRLTVVGKIRKDWSCPKARWVVRCACGDFEVRKSKSILNPANDQDCCHHCRQVIQARKAHEYRTTGVNQ